MRPDYGWSINGTERKDLLERLMQKGEVLDYLIITYKKIDPYDLIWKLEHGFFQADYDRLQSYLDEGDGEQSQAEMDADENSYMDRMR